MGIAFAIKMFKLYQISFCIPNFKEFITLFLFSTIQMLNTHDYNRFHVSIYAQKALKITTLLSPT